MDAERSSDPVESAIPEMNEWTSLFGDGWYQIPCTVGIPIELVNYIAQKEVYMKNQFEK